MTKVWRWLLNARSSNSPRAVPVSLATNADQYRVPPSPERVRRRSSITSAAPKLPHFRHSPSTGCREEWSKCMELPPANVEWHLVRDGKPYGPLSELEFLKFIE